MSSPWKILGIKAGSDRDTIRRAYAKKLKGVNPEDDPEGFMRLRQAHDDALAQLRWRRPPQGPERDGPEPEAPDSEPADASPPAGSEDANWLAWTGPPPDGPHGSAPPPTYPTESGPASVPRGEPDPAAAALAAEQADLATRQQALIDAIAAGPEGQLTALDHLLAAPALEAIAARERIERWIAATIRRQLPASDPLVVAAIERFGWGELGAIEADADVASLLQRRDEGAFVARIARPHTDLHVGYMALQGLKGPGWWRRVTALFGAAPEQTRTILGLVDGPMPGIASWLDPDAMAWWRDWHSEPRLRLWMFAVLFPLAAVALVAVLEPTGWPEAVQAGAGLLAYAAPFAMVWLLNARRRVQAQWQRPAWHYQAWMLAVPGLPVLAAAWPPFAELGPLWLLIVVGAAAWTLVTLPRLLPDAPKTLMVGLIRAWPMWVLLGMFMLPAPLPVWASPILGLLVTAMMLLWWQGGDELSWLAQARFGRWSVWAVSGLGALVIGAAAGLVAMGGIATEANAWLPRALALLPLALALLLMGVRLASGALQAVPLLLMVGMFQMLIITLPESPQRARETAAPAVPAKAIGSATDWIAAEPLLKGKPSRTARLPRPDPVISCDGVGDGGTSAAGGPMVAEPCMAEDWIRDGEYPPAALALGQGGTVGYRLLVDRTGRVESCDIVESSGHAALDKGTCDLVGRRARFVPARGVDGRTMEWAYRGRIRWVLGDS